MKEDLIRTSIYLEIIEQPDTYKSLVFHTEFVTRKKLVKLRISSRKLGLRQVDTTMYRMMKSYAVSAIVTELKMKLTFC